MTDVYVAKYLSDAVGIVLNNNDFGWRGKVQ
jgi:hypothetical protein